ncbi:MAG: hypothetical protein QW708_03030 [Desulfurococcaceae archaeon]
MFHPGSMEYIDRHLNELVNNAIELNVHGVAASATRPRHYKKGRRDAWRKDSRCIRLE